LSLVFFLVLLCQQIFSINIVGTWFFKKSRIFVEKNFSAMFANILVALAIIHVIEASDPSDAVLLTSISSLTFVRGELTAYRRVAPMPALTCNSGSACGTHLEPDVVRCTNVGHDGVDVQWQCEASTSARFGKMKVSCEGYDYPEDPRVLVGSCALIYTLHATRFPSSSSTIIDMSDTHPTAGEVLWLIIVLVVFAWIVALLAISCGDDNDDVYRSKASRARSTHSVIHCNHTHYDPMSQYLWLSMIRNLNSSSSSSSSSFSRGYSSSSGGSSSSAIGYATTSRR
jgi:hypothetical protein